MACHLVFMTQKTLKTSFATFDSLNDF